MKLLCRWNFLLSDPLPLSLWAEQTKNRRVLTQHTSLKRLYSPLLFFFFRWNRYLELPSKFTFPRGRGSNHLRIFYPKIVECPGNTQKANNNEVLSEHGAISQEKWRFVQTMRKLKGGWLKDLLGILWFRRLVIIFSKYYWKMNERICPFRWEANPEIITFYAIGGMLSRLILARE